MSFAIPSPSDCCSPCAEPVVTNIPGVPGANGADGAAGADGNNAYTVTTDPFTMPAEGGTVVVSVVLSGWAVIGQVVAVGDPAGAAFGYFQVTAIPTATTITLLNLENTAAGTYAANSAVGTVFPATSAVSPAGLQGPTGAAGVSGAPTDATYITQTPDATLSAEQALSTLASGLMTNTTGTGVVSITAKGVADTNVAPVDQVAGMTANRMVAATAAGIETPTQANARTYLGLGTMATQNANAVAITGGTITGVTLTAPSGLAGAYGLYTHVETSGNDGGDFNTGAWQTVPLNTKAAGDATVGSINAGTSRITLTTGVYRVRGSVCANQVGSFTSRLYNITDGVVETSIAGTAEVVPTADPDSHRSLLQGVLTVAGGPKVYEVQAYCSNTKAGDGFGYGAGLGVDEVFSTLELERET